MGREDPWLARIEDIQGRVHGAGTMLDGEYVLTCAHVVEEAICAGRGADREVRVRIAGRPDDAYPATVVESCWQPPLPDQRGDVAILALRSVVPGAPRARIRRTWQHDEIVRIFGFPAGTDNGQLVSARIASYDFTGERVQLDAVLEPRVDHGFSGAAALAAGGEILGVIAVVRAPLAESSWMIAVRTLYKYASAVLDGHLTSRPSRVLPGDWPSLQVPEVLDDPVQLALTRHLVGWLASGGPGGVCAIGGGGAVALTSRLVGLTVPGYRRTAPDGTVSGAPPGTVPQLGEVDAAVDATGRTTEQVAQQLAESLSLLTDRVSDDLSQQLAELGSPIVVVVNAVDLAADPAELYYRLLEPIAARASSIGVRLLLAYHGDPPRYVRSAVAASLGQPAATASPSGRHGGERQFDDRLGRLDRSVEEVEAAERDARVCRDYVAPRILGAPPPQVAGAAALAVRLRVLRDTGSAAAGSALRGWLLGELDACEKAAARSLVRARRLNAECAALLARRNRARGRLDAYRSEAAARGLIEELGESYEAARRLLYSSGCDLPLAELRVEEYHRAVRHEIDRRQA
ncbi:trypsin-like peptidase domain-containing protein [Streptomyces sp. XY431]|uniref:trypsin-like peptidase domain-containing protein n=1 Tax=Streptomyces sp. XY431 TaxID=1415562 RepID=UPI00099CE706|nr:trypsin-like peptidase domain-containing protein [Streptomyces sp. XY431]